MEYNGIQIHMSSYLCRLHVIILTCPMYVDACILTCPKNFFKWCPPKIRRSTTFVAGPSLSPSRGDPAAVPTARRAVGLEFLREPLEVPIGRPWRWDGTSYENLWKSNENLWKSNEIQWKPMETPMKSYGRYMTRENYENTSCPGNALQPKFGEVWWESDGVKNDVDIVYLLYYDAWCQDLFW